MRASQANEQSKQWWNMKNATRQTNNEGMMKSEEDKNDVNVFLEVERALSSHLPQGANSINIALVLRRLWPPHRRTFFKYTFLLSVEIFAFDLVNLSVRQRLIGCRMSMTAPYSPHPLERIGNYVDVFFSLPFFSVNHA